MSKKLPTKAIEIKISTVVAVSAILHDVDLTSLDSAMQAITAGQPDYFEGEPAVIDLGALEADAAVGDWPALIALFKRHRLNAVAVRNAPAGLEEEILANGLSIDVVSRREEKSAEEPVPAPEIASAPASAVVPAAAAATAMIVDTPVRAGQRIYSRGDLIVTAAVNNGAEVIADGSIHVYAPLRGRALAGASGNLDARIFATSMEPELVSIAGIYRTFDAGFPKDQARKPAQIRLIDNRLDIMALEPNTR